ncbi:MAG: hypothetical protein AN483_20985 [Aphanizomenon flos-aquae MDT14a]|nr:MAG: hypothetical protein AN483_20985 [Aphanizomenon flos-aquae MDT14a]
MSLAELIPLVNNLSQLDKLSLFKLLAAQIPNAELQVIFSASSGDHARLERSHSSRRNVLHLPRMPGTDEAIRNIGRSTPGGQLLVTGKVPIVGFPHVGRLRRTGRAVRWPGRGGRAAPR